MDQLKTFTQQPDHIILHTLIINSHWSSNIYAFPVWKSSSAVHWWGLLKLLGQSRENLAAICWILQISPYDLHTLWADWTEENVLYVTCQDNVAQCCKTRVVRPRGESTCFSWQFRGRPVKNASLNSKTRAFGTSLWNSLMGLPRSFETSRSQESGWLVSS